MNVTVTLTAFELAQKEVKVFPVSLTSEKNMEIKPKVAGVEGGCLQSAGCDYLGKPFERAVVLKAGEEKRLWFYIKAPEKEGESSFFIEFYAEKELVARQDFTLKTTKKKADDSQFDDIYSLRRLIWLDSTRGIDDKIAAPFSPVKVDGQWVRILGRELCFGTLGLPVSVRSYFTQGIKIGADATEILSDEMRFKVGSQSFENRSFSLAEENGKARISAKNESEDFIWEITAEAESDGYVSYEMALQAKRNIAAYVRLEIPVSENCCKYFMGLEKDGGRFDGVLDWKWDERKQQDGFWTGNVNAGIRLQFKDENYRKPLVNIYYAHKPLFLPASWHNGGRGGIFFEKDTFVAYSGVKDFKKGERLRFDFTMMITPFKEIDLKKQLNMRFYHKLDGQPEEWLSKAKEKGANLINVHHGNDLNPYINYPFFEREALTDFVQEAHAKGIKVKIYYTVRELTVNMPEFSVLRDFGYEIFEKKDENVRGELWQGEAKEWIYENIGADVIPAWRQELHGVKYKEQFDSSVITNGTSRLCNFYIEALHNLLFTTDIDGLYIDDVAYGRDTMKRVRKTLDERQGRYIDLHTWNHNFNDYAGHASCLNLYAELLPYIDKLWIGEGFDYGAAPDYWLIEMSGIPFGVMSEMLEADWQKANPWKGLLFGMTTRLGWCEEADPTNMWKVFDEYALSDGEIIGWWDERNEFVCDCAQVLVTEYWVNGKRYLAAANFGEEDKVFSLRLKSGEKTCFYAPYIEKFQEEMRTDGKFALPAGKGLFLICF